MNKLQFYTNQGDGEIIQEILAGEKQCFEAIIRRYNTYLYKIGRSYGFDHDDTEDLMQEVYVSAYTHLKDFANRSSFKTWLVRIMLNSCYHKREKYKCRESSLLQQTTGNRFPSALQLQSKQYTGENIVLMKELGHIIEAALLKIPQDFRLVFTLRELNGLSTQETSEVLSITSGNVKTRLNRAKALLRTEISKIYTREDIFEFNLIYCDKIVGKVMTVI